jgi:hypothetical protein
MGFGYITFYFVFGRVVPLLSTEVLQNFKISLFTPTNSTNFSTQLSGTLADSFW